MMRRRRALRDEPERLPDVRRVVDARHAEDMGIGHVQGDELVTYHVTDRPVELVRFLRGRPNLIAAYGEKGRSAELGPGLYASENPNYWAGRSRNKWSFLKTMNGDQWRRLLDALRREVDRLEDQGRITPAERSYALRDITLVQSERASDDVLVGTLANQPYNIAFWRPEFLKPLGIAPGGRTGIVELRVRGRFAELSRSYPSPSTLRTLRRAGLQGAFTRAGMSTNPELVIWDPRAIVSARVEQATERDRSRPRSRRVEGGGRTVVSPYRLARRRYWQELQRILYDEYDRVPTRDGHFHADAMFRRKVPVRELAARMAKDRRLTASAYEIQIEPLW